MATKRKDSKKRTKRKLDLPTWLAEQIKAAGVTQFQISEETGVNPNDLSRWKNGQAVPEMDNLLRLAHYFKEDPERLFEMARKPELIEVYRLFLPKYQKRQLTEEDLYKNRKHAELHRRMESILLTAITSLEVFEGYIEEEEKEHYFYYRLDELIKLTHADDGKIFHGQIDFEEGKSVWLIPFEEFEFDRENPPKGWTMFAKEERKGTRGVEVQLFLKNPKLQPFIRELIEVYLQDWLKGAWPGASHEET